MSQKKTNNLNSTSSKNVKYVYLDKFERVTKKIEEQTYKNDLDIHLLNKGRAELDKSITKVKRQLYGVITLVISIYLYLIFK